MKMFGKPLPGPNHETVVLPRPEGDSGESQDIVFECHAVLDFDPFEKIYPEPTPPQKLVRGETKQRADFDSPKYKTECNVRDIARMSWLTIQSIKDTPGLEWEKVKPDDPKTWGFWIEELREGGLTIPEVARIQQAVYAVNGMDDAKMEAARKAFLAGKGQQQAV